MQSKLCKDMRVCITKGRKTTPEINSDSLLWNVGFWVLFLFLHFMCSLTLTHMSRKCISNVILEFLCFSTGGSLWSVGRLGFQDCPRSTTCCCFIWILASLPCHQWPPSVGPLGGHGHLPHPSMEGGHM